MDKITLDGYRLNVGMVLLNSKNEVLLGRRSDDPDTWQFPQGGIGEQEEPLEAMYRELAEEVGLAPHHVELIAVSRTWLQYDIPIALQRSDRPKIRGQKQRWFLLRMLDDEDMHDGLIDLAAHSQPEFSDVSWVSYWQPLKNIIYFKREVYRAVLTEFEMWISPENGAI